MRTHIELIDACFVVLVLLRISHTVAGYPVPDSAGCAFRFSNPLCSVNYPSILHVIPQTTDAVNVTLTSHDAVEKTEYSIRPYTSLRITLPCKTFQWGRVYAAGFSISTTSEVIVYVDNQDDNMHIFPSDVAGTSYVVTAYLTSHFLETFIVVHGTNSTVEVILPDNCSSVIFNVDGKNLTGNTKFTLTLNENSVIGVIGKCDITGASVTADLPVAVFAGSLATNGAWTIEQTPPTFTFGRRFLYAAHHWVHQNVTLIIAGLNMSTEVVFTTNTVTKRVSTGTSFILNINITADVFLSVETNSSVSCFIVQNIFDSSGDKHTSVRYLTPMRLYHVRKYFIMDKPGEYSANMLVEQTSKGLLVINQTKTDPFKKAMTYYWNLFIYQNVELLFPHQIYSNDSNKLPLSGSVCFRENRSAYEYQLSMRVIPIYSACIPHIYAHGGNGDGIDNDCDSLIDEELLNSVDDDNDGLVDEDVQYSGTLFVHARETPYEYHMRNREKAAEGISSSVISIVITFVVAITAVFSCIGGMFVIEKVRRSSRTTRITPIS
ncbi:uncharacterized protein LOC127872968 [Dreissena polymorpha]|uniref:uncharacterized protein LOC127872968 n=1 Tax=Dreissena polymorpha TaxID=45954 RepID=UPI002265509A|nr:uncharacterized protein LOC127872968 [Dreissena polymorpha]